MAVRRDIVKQNPTSDTKCEFVIFIIRSTYYIFSFILKSICADFWMYCLVNDAFHGFFSTLMFFTCYTWSWFRNSLIWGHCWGHNLVLLIVSIDRLCDTRWMHKPNMILICYKCNADEHRPYFFGNVLFVVPLDYVFSVTVNNTYGVWVLYVTGRVTGYRHFFYGLWDELTRRSKDIFSSNNKTTIRNKGRNVRYSGRGGGYGGMEVWVWQSGFFTSPPGYQMVRP